MLLERGSRSLLAFLLLGSAIAPGAPCLGTALGSAPTLPAGGVGDALFERALDNALREARRELVSSLDLYTDHSTWDNAWSVESEHYHVRTTRSQYLAAKTAQDLEFMLRQFQGILGTDHVPRQRFEVWILPSLPEYNATGGNSDEHSSFYGSFVLTDRPGWPLVTYETPNAKLLSMWITHTAFHQFALDAFGASPPTWISEGLASYFSLYWDWEWGAQSLRDLIAQKRYIRLSYLKRTDLKGFLDRPEDRLVVLGMFFKYMLHHNLDTRISASGEPTSPVPFVEFLRASMRGSAGSRHPFNEYLDEELTLVEAEFRGFDFGN